MGNKKGKTIVAFTTIGKDDNLKTIEWSKQTYLWTYEDGARDNADNGGHRVVMLTLQVVDAREVE